MKDHQTTNQPQQPLPLPPYPYYPTDDEIDLKDLVRKAWKTRGVWIISMVIVSLLFWGWWSIKQMTSLAPLTYSLPIQLNFEGVDKGSYPNGSPFNRSDLIAPNVIQSVFKQHNLDQYGLTLDKFSTMVRLTPYAVDLNLLQEKYRQELDNKKLSPQDIDTLRDRQREEVNQASLRGVQLTFTQEETEIPDNIINNILSDIPKVWSKKAINERGVLDINIGSVSESILDKEVLNKLDYMITMDYLIEKIGIIRESILELEGFPNGLTAEDPETRATLSDLLNKINDLQTYQLDPLSGPIQTMGLSKRSEVTLHHYLNKKNGLETTKKELLQKAKLTGSIYQDYIQSGYEQKSSIGDNQTLAQSRASVNDLTPQLGGGFLDRIMQIFDKSSDIVFRQNLINEKKDYESRAIEIDTELTSILRNIESLKRQDQGQDQGQGRDQEIRSYFLKELKNEIPLLLVQLNSIIQTRERILEQISSNSRGEVDSLYNLISAGSISGGRITLFAKQEKLIYLLLLVLTTIVVIPGVMIRNSLRNPDDENSVD